MRVTAIFLLVTAHVSQETGSALGGYFGIKNIFYVSLGGIAVSIFLFVSGAGLAMSRRNQRSGYRNFIVRRILRIYPVYYMCLVGMEIYLALISLRVTGAAGLQAAGFQKADAILALTGFYAFAGKWGGPVLATSWFVGLIMTFYFIYPFLANAVRRNPHLAISIILLASIVARLVLGRYDILPNRPLDWFPLCRLFEFSSGIYIVTVVRPQVLSGSNIRYPEWMRKIVRYASELSFPLFLVHYPLLHLVPAFTSRGIGVAASVLVYLFASFALSWIVCIIDRRIPRESILEKVDHGFLAGRRKSASA
ncbi:MAG: acyltransferase family protein [Syntrophales bacterium]|nr:acyltransferase family protein [Syntrophales bacterium]MDD5533145.1 acyltransferase family protein [Syntrophales bacterium]